MFGRIFSAAAATAIALAGLAAPAGAQGFGYDNGYYSQVSDHRHRDRWDDRGRHGYRGDRGHYRERGYRGRHRGYRSRHCDRGTGGTIIGAVAGGLLGNTVAGRGDRTVGTIAGAGVGALAGRAIDRDC